MPGDDLKNKMPESDGRRELMCKIGEESIYTAKGYFKCFDSASVCKNVLLWLNLFLMVASVALAMFDCCETVGKVLVVTSLVDMVILLYLDGKCSDAYLCDCQKLANAYLSLHKRARSAYFGIEGDSEKIDREMRKLDEQVHPRIHSIARIWAKLAIEKFGEVDLWFKEADR